MPCSYLQLYNAVSASALCNIKQSLSFLYAQCKIPYHRRASSTLGNWVYLSQADAQGTI